jgi:hypothetical protein
VLCCVAHTEDAEVARLAAQRLEVPITEIPMHLQGARLAHHLREVDASVLLCCAEGTEAWRSSGAPAVVYGDGLFVRWWRAAELRMAG